MKNLYAYAVRYFDGDEGKTLHDTGVIHGKDFTGAMIELNNVYDWIEEVHLFQTECEGGYMTEEVINTAMKWAHNSLSNN